MGANEPLFRREVVAAGRARLGSVVFAPPALLAVGALASTLAIAVLSTLLVSGEYAPRQTVTGFLAPHHGLVKVTAPRAGKAEFVYAKDGARVTAGQTLALVSADQQYVDSQGKSVLERMLRELDTQSNRINESIGAEADKKESDASALSARMAGLRDELDAERAGQIALAQQKTSVEATYRRLETLHASGYVTAIELAARHEQILELERQWQDAAKRVAQAENQVRNLEFEIQQQPAQRKQSEAALLNQLSQLKREILSYDASRGYAITAPISGRITALQLEAGKSVDTTAPLMSILADDTLFEARLLVPSRAIGFVRTGQPVRLRYAAFPHQSYGTYAARVSEVSRATLRPDELAVGLPLAEPMYRVNATLESQTVHARGGDQPLQAGMLLEADIVLEQRPLWTWVFQPLLAFEGRL